MRKRYIVVDLLTNRFLNQPYRDDVHYGAVDGAYKFDWSNPELEFPALLQSFRERKRNYLIEGRLLSLVTVWI
jgi:hypothetical protein